MLEFDVRVLVLLNVTGFCCSCIDTAAQVVPGLCVDYDACTVTLQRFDS